MKIIVNIATHYRMHFLLSMTLSFMAGALSVFLISNLKKILPSFAPGSFFLFVGCCAVLYLLSYLSQYFSKVVGNFLIRDIRAQMVSDVLETDEETASRWDPSELYTIMTEDVIDLSYGIGALPNLILQLSIFGLGLAYIFWISNDAFYLVASLMTLGILLTNLAMKRFRKLQRELRKDVDLIHQQLQKVVNGGILLRQNPVLHKKWQTGSFQPLIEKYKSNSDTGHMYWALGSSSVSPMLILVIGCVAFLSQFSTLGELELVSIVVMLLFLRPSVQGIVNSIPEIVRANIAFQNVKTKVNYQNSRQPNPFITPEIRDVSLKLNCSKVTYQYSTTDPFHLAETTFEVEPYQKVFLTGSNGSGKSTLIKILSGVMSPTKGQVKVLDAKGYNLSEDLRQYVAPVYQEPHFFGLPTNYYSGSFDKSAFNNWLITFNLDTDIQVEALDSRKLSSGQKKRLAIIYAILDKRPFIVMDEPAAEQDPWFRHYFYNELLNYLCDSGRTLIVVTHDSQYFHHADKVIEIARN